MTCFRSCAQVIRLETCEKKVSQLTNKSRTQRRLTRLKNVRAVRCSASRRSQGNCYSSSAKTLKNKSHSHSLVTIDDLSTDDAIGDLPNECLAIECLPTISATMTKKRTKSVLRSTLSNSGLAIPIFVEVLGPMCFSAWSSHFSGYKCWFYLALRTGSATVLLLLGSPLFCTSVLKIWIVTLHCDRALATTSVVMRRVVGDVDRRGLVQEPATSFFPPIGHLMLPIVFLSLLISVLLS